MSHHPDPNSGLPEPKVPRGRIPASVAHLIPPGLTGAEADDFLARLAEFGGAAARSEFGTPAKLAGGAVDASESPWMTPLLQSQDASTLRVQGNQGGTIKTGGSAKR